MSSTMLSVLFNLGSLTLGCGAWILGLLALRAKKPTGGLRLSVCSFGSCAAALLLQLMQVRNRANIGDFSAIEDTIAAVVFAAVVLLIVTILLNTAAIIRAGMLLRKPKQT